MKAPVQASTEADFKALKARIEGAGS